MPDNAEARDPSEPPSASRPEPAGAGTRSFWNALDGPQAMIGTNQFASPDAATAANPRPDVVPGYEIVAELDRGGMGVVYKARDTRLNRDVALKMILRDDAGRVAVGRFWAEAEVMAAVRHPHVVQVYELGEHDGRLYMVMEFVAGGSLEKRIERGPIPPKEAAALLAKVASGVAAAHELEIVHRDLKPANVLLTSDGEPKVTDFGIAKRRAHSLTQTHAVLGTPAYMAPEQAAARAKFVGPPADVWSLGVILYECLAGVRPFDGPTVDTLLSQIRSEEPRPLRARLATVPGDLETIVAKCLSKEPEHRYPAAGELAADLGRFLRGEPIAARRAGAPERLTRWARRKPTAAAAWVLSLLAVALVLVVLVVFGFWRDAEGAKRYAESARDEAVYLGNLADASRAEEHRLRGLADAARDDAVRLRGVAEDAKRGEEKARKEVEREREKLVAFAYGRTVQVAHQEWRDNNVSGALALLLGTPEALRGWEWHYVHGLCRGALTLSGHAGPVFDACFSPDGSRLVTASMDKTARVWDAKTGKELFALKGHTDGVRSACFSADGSRIVTASWGGAAKIWNAKTGNELFALKNTRRVHSPSFSADGSRIVTGSDDNTAKVWDAKTGDELLTLRGHTDWVNDAEFSPDGTRIVTASYDNTARVWEVPSAKPEGNAKDGTELFTLKGHRDWVSVASFSADGSRIVTGSEDNTARVWDAKTGDAILALNGHASSVLAASFSPDGARVLTGSKDKTAKVWEVPSAKPEGVAKTGAEIMTLRHTNGISSACFSPDGSRVVLSGGSWTARVWEVPLAKLGGFATREPEALTLKAHKRGLSCASFSTDGSRIVTGSEDSTARVWNPVTGAELLVLKGHAGGLHAASFSPDGSRIVTGSEDETAKVWNAHTGAELFTLKHPGDVRSASFSTDWSRIVTAGPGGFAKVWNAATGAELLTLKDPRGMSSACFSPDGSRIVTASSDKTAKVWNAHTGAELLVLRGHADVVESVRFSPDGSRIVTASSDMTARVWSAETGAELLTLKSDSGVFLSACFSPDGSRIVTSGSDQTARVWDAKTGAEVLTLKGHAGWVSTASFSADGSRLVTASGDGTAKVWDAPPRPPEPLPREVAPPPRAVK